MIAINPSNLTSFLCPHQTTLDASFDGSWSETFFFATSHLMQSTITARYFSKLKASVSLASGLSKASRHSCRVWESNRQALEISENILYTFRTMGYCLFFVCGKTIMSNFNAFSLAKTPKNPPKHLSYRLVIFWKSPTLSDVARSTRCLRKISPSCLKRLSVPSDTQDFFTIAPCV